MLSDAYTAMDELMPTRVIEERLKSYQSPFAKGRRFVAGRWIEIHVEAESGTVFCGRFHILDVNEFDVIGIIARCELEPTKAPVFLRIGVLERKAKR